MKKILSSGSALLAVSVIKAAILERKCRGKRCEGIFLRQQNEKLCTHAAKFPQPAHTNPIFMY